MSLSGRRGADHIILKVLPSIVEFKILGSSGGSACYKIKNSNLQKNSEGQPVSLLS